MMTMITIIIFIVIMSIIASDEYDDWDDDQDVLFFGMPWSILKNGKFLGPWTSYF